MRKLPQPSSQPPSAIQRATHRNAGPVARQGHSLKPAEPTPPAASAPLPATPPVRPARRRLLIIDDHPILRAGIVAVVEASDGWEVCAEADTGAAGIQLARELQPDLILLDIELPDCDGLHLLHTLIQTLPNMFILVLSMHPELKYAEAALRAGARGYLMKHSGAQPLIEAMNEVMAGRVFVTDVVKNNLLLNLRKRPMDLPQKSAPGRYLNLSRRQTEIFQLIGQGRGTGSIAMNLNLSPKTVNVHRARIKQALGITSLPALIHAAILWNESSRSPIDSSTKET